MKDYFDFFKTLYDEKLPVGNLGRGTHYSVFRSISWLGVDLKPISQPQFHDFALIWDEDHDERITAIAERLYLEKLLPPVLFLGERKGCLTVLVNAALPDSFLTEYQAKIQKIAESVENDPWSVQVSKVESDENPIINAENERVHLYLKNIISLWNLGVKETTVIA